MARSAGFRKRGDHRYKVQTPRFEHENRSWEEELDPLIEIHSTRKEILGIYPNIERPREAQS